MTDSLSNSAHTLLIVDDDANVLASLSRLFRKENFAVTPVLTGDEALRRLRTETYDVVLCDETMPGLRGSEVLHTIRERWPDTVRIMMTANADLELALRVINDGEAYRFVIKPWNDTELLITLYQAFEKADLVRENRRLHEEVRRHQETLAVLEQQFPGITRRRIDNEGYYIASSD